MGLWPAQGDENSGELELFSTERSEVESLP